MKAGDVGLVGSEQELAEFGAVVGWAFGSPQVKATEWLARGGVDNVRVVRSSARVVAGLLEVPMGQWFMGRSVPMLGIAGVAVAPEARGQGVALSLMQRTLRDARARGFELSALYPSTNTLYRAVGYELAGAYYRYSMRAADCPREKSALPVTLTTPDDQREITALYGEMARQRTGYLDRGPFVWNRVREPHEETALGVLARGSEGLEGYAYMNQRPSSTGDYELVLSDLVAKSPRALARLFNFLAEHRSTAGNVVWRASLADAGLLAFKERVFSVSVEKYWMLRVVDVRAALEARGYPNIDAEVALEIEDELLPENSGVHRLSVQKGAANVMRAKGSGVRLGPRALAALYTGFMSAEELEHAGMLSGNASALRTLSLLFAGPAPTMVDYF
jgi:predicted acetyltransferase